ncbi:MAG TPA: queuosine precursor transporter [Rhabdochlamydiaceae bacterium]|jgi:hypothetical protein
MKKRFLTYQILCSSFCVILILSNIFSAKMVDLPWLSLSIPAGLIIYPLSFLLSDLVTEIYGPRRAKLMVYIAFGMSLLSFILIYIALLLPTADAQQQSAFQAIMGLSSLRIFSSLISYIIAQNVDISLYALLKKKTRFLWLRSNGSTWFSQLIDTLVIDLIFLYWGLGWSLTQVFPVMAFSYAYKAFFSLLLTPLFCFSASWFKRKKAPAF